MKNILKNKIYVFLGFVSLGLALLSVVFGLLLWPWSLEQLLKTGAISTIGRDTLLVWRWLFYVFAGFSFSGVVCFAALYMDGTEQRLQIDLGDEDDPAPHEHAQEPTNQDKPITIVPEQQSEAHPSQQDTHQVKRDTDITTPRPIEERRFLWVIPYKIMSVLGISGRDGVIPDATDPITRDLFITNLAQELRSLYIITNFSRFAHHQDSDIRNAVHGAMVGLLLRLGSASVATGVLSMAGLGALLNLIVAGGGFWVSHNAWKETMRQTEVMREQTEATREQNKSLIKQINNDYDAKILEYKTKYKSNLYSRESCSVVDYFDDVCSNRKRICNGFDELGYPAVANSDYDSSLRFHKGFSKVFMVSEIYERLSVLGLGEQWLDYVKHGVGLEVGLMDDRYLMNDFLIAFFSSKVFGVDGRLMRLDYGFWADLEKRIRVGLVDICIGESDFRLDDYGLSYCERIFDYDGVVLDGMTHFVQVAFETALKDFYWSLFKFSSVFSFGVDHAGVVYVPLRGFCGNVAHECSEYSNVGSRCPKENVKLREDAVVNLVNMSGGGSSVVSKLGDLKYLSFSDFIGISNRGKGSGFGLGEFSNQLNLDRVDFSGMSLAGLKFFNVDIDKVVFDSVDFKGVEFWFVDSVFLELSHFDLSDVVLRFLGFKRVSGHGGNLSGVDVIGLRLDDSSFSAFGSRDLSVRLFQFHSVSVWDFFVVESGLYIGDMRNFRLSDGVFYRFDVGGLNTFGFRVFNAWVSEFLVYGSFFEHSYFSRVFFGAGVFRDGVFRVVDFFSVFFDSVDFVSMVFEGNDFSGFYFGDFGFFDCSFKRVVFRDGLFEDGVFGGEFDSVVFDVVDFRNVDLSSARFYGPVDLSTVCWDERTIWPEGVNTNGPRVSLGCLNKK